MARAAEVRVTGESCCSEEVDQQLLVSASSSIFTEFVQVIFCIRRLVFFEVGKIGRPTRDFKNVGESE